MPRKRRVLNTTVYPLYKIETAKSVGVERWKAQVTRITKVIKEKLSRCSLKLDFFISEERFSKVDVDNLAKPILDALEKAGAYDDDTLVIHLEVTKVAVFEPLLEKVHIELFEWE